MRFGGSSSTPSVAGTIVALTVAIVVTSEVLEEMGIGLASAEIQQASRATVDGLTTFVEVGLALGLGAIALPILVGLSAYVCSRVAKRTTWPPTLGRRQRVKTIELFDVDGIVPGRGSPFITGGDVGECVVCEEDVAGGEVRVWRDATVVGPVVARVHEEGTHAYCARCATNPLDGMLEAERVEDDQDEKAMPVGFAGEPLLADQRSD